MRLSWTRSPTADFVAYRVYRSTAPGVTQASTLVAEIADRAETSLTVTGLQPSTAYYFRVFVCDAQARCSGSNEAGWTSASPPPGIRPDGAFFGIPPEPHPPIIVSVDGAAPAVGEPAEITVTARGREQTLFNEDHDRFFPADPHEAGGCNPVEIAQVWGHYTKDPASGYNHRIALECASGGCNCANGACGTSCQAESVWQGHIPASVHAAEDETVYYIVSVLDSAGNIAVEDPDPDQGPAPHNDPSSGGWGADSPSVYQAPWIDNADKGEPLCSDGNSRYAVCDKRGDQIAFTGGPGPGAVDILGVNLGADAESVFVNMDFAAAIPDPGSLIETYSITFFNPDAQDPDPYDYHFYDAFAVLYAPKQGSITGAVMPSTFWDIECLANPDTLDHYACRYAYCELGADCVVQPSGASLYFSVKHSTRGNGFFGTSSAEMEFTKMAAASGQVDLNTDEIYVASDHAPGLGYYRRHQYQVAGAP